MKIQSLISLAMAAFPMTACSDEEEPASNATKGMLKATVEGSYSSTRAGFDDKGAFYWSMKDRLGVTTTENANKFSSLDLTSGGGTASATFDGTISGTIDGYAVYPYNDSHSMSGTTLTYSFPSTYTYTQVDGDYFTATQGDGNSFNPAMWGKIASGSVQMKHLGGVFCIKIPKMPIAQGILSLVSDKKIAGNFTVDLNATDPVLTSTETSSTDNTVTITFSNATENQPGVFYVPVPVGNYDVRIKVAESQEATEKINVAAGVYAIARRDLKKIELNNGSIDATAPTESGSLSDAASSLQNNDAVSVTEEISASSTNEISIPSVTSGSEETSKSLSLEKVATGASLNVSDANTSNDAATSVDKFTLSIPNNESDDFKPLDVTIDMKYSTVTLTGNAGAATYGTVTATTADNTLIIDENVTVDKLIAKKGNIRLKDNACIKELEFDAKYAIYIYTETDNYTLPAVLPNGFKIQDAVFADMKAALKNGGSYQLIKDMDLGTISFTVPEGKSAVLDLNGHTLKAQNNGSIKVKGTLTLKDLSAGQSGKIMANRDRNASFNTGLINVTGENAKLIMESGTIDAVRENPATNGQCGVFLEQGGDFTMTGGTIKAGDFALAGNGNDKTQNSVILIQGGELSSAADYAVYLPQSGTTTISGGTVSGAAGGVCIQRGTLEISGENTVVKSLGTGSTSDAGDGTGGLSDAAICVAAEYGDCTVTIKGGHISGEKEAAAISTPKGTSYKQTVSVTGGTFSDLSIANYLGVNAEVKVLLNKNTEIKQPVVINQNFATLTIDLNNYDIVNQTEINNGGNWETEGFIVRNGTLNIQGNGNVKCISNTNNDGYREVITAEGGIVNIYGGYFYNSQNVSGQLDLIYANMNGVINIYGGTFESNGYKNGYWVLNIKDAYRNTAHINVYGGTFKNFNPANNHCEGNNTNFVADGYEVTCDGEVAEGAHTSQSEKKDYVVRKKTTD